MRIIHFLDDYAQVGGASAYAHQLITYLDDAGHDNIVVFARPHPPELQYPARCGFHVPQADYPAPPDDATAQISQIIADGRPDVAFVHHVYHPRIVEFIVDRLPAIAYVQAPYVFCPGYRQYLPRSERACGRTAGLMCLGNNQLQHCMFGRNPATLWKHLRRTRDFLTVYGRLHRVIAGSRFMRDMLAANGVPGERLVISPTFLCEPGLYPAPITDAGQPPVILFSGRIVREKGLHHLLAALSNVPQPWRLVVAGAGPDEAFCRQLAERSGISVRVDFRGWVSPEEAALLTSSCDIVAVPSLWPEPFGRVGPEAFVRGKPVVGYASGGISDWLHDGVNGMLVPPADVAALGRALATLLADASLRQRLGRQAYSRVLADYSIENHVPVLLALLEDAIRVWRAPAV
jgi:glycosyltransferase involved in cell wall biosynthesis